MEIKITTSPQNVEMANFLLKQAYEDAKNNKAFLSVYNVTKKDLDKAEEFRLALLKSFTHKQGNQKKMI